MKREPKQSGFTIIELMIATTVFGVLVLIATGAVIMISRHFYKGLVMSRTQEVARNVTEEVSRNIQFSASNPSKRESSDGSIKALCIAGKEYIYKPNVRLKDPGSVDEGEDRVFRRADDCTTDLDVEGLPADGIEMLGIGMRVIGDIKVEEVPGTFGRGWYLSVRIVHAENDMLEDTINTGDGVLDTCVSNLTESSFCAASQLDVTVFKRT